MIKLFEAFNDYNQVKDWLDYMAIPKYTINDDLSVDVNGSVDLYNKQLTEIPIQFNIVNGSFDCSDNNLTSLKGCPKVVDGNFFCCINQLTSLKGCPTIIGFNFDCSFNSITSLDSGLREIGGNFNCSTNRLTTLKGSPEVIGNFDCSDNELPQSITNFKDFKIFIKYQDEYSIWNKDGSLNEQRYLIFLQDYKAGILN